MLMGVQATVLKCSSSTTTTKRACLLGMGPAAVQQLVCHVQACALRRGALHDQAASDWTAVL